MTSFYDLFTAPPDPQRTDYANVTPLDPARATRYATKALTSECENVANAAEGTRNDTLNTAAFSLGQLVAAGHLTHDDTWRALAHAASAAGLDQHEIDATLRSGLGAGAQQPRVVPDQDPHVPAATILAEPTTGSDDSNEQPGEQGGSEVATWAPQNLDDILDGTYTPELPTLLPRTDDQHLLYPGRVHSFHGESESGKSLVAQAEGARLMAAGHQVLFIDFESDRAAVVGRMLELGATPTQLRNHFTYVNPDVDPRRFPHEREAVTDLLAKPYGLAVIDGVTEALGVFGASTKDNDDITAWIRLLPRTVARMTGAAVVLVDHVTKSSEDRGRFAIGGQAKMAALDGAAYVVEVTEALGRGKKGMVTLRVAKDRPGGVRAHAGPFRPTDRTQEAARIVIDSTTGDDLIHVTVGEPRTGEDDQGAPTVFRPTRLMERISRHLEDADEALSKAVIEGLAGANRDTVRTALAFLVKEHFAREEKGARGALLHSSIQPYREARDRHSDAYVPAPTTITSPTSPDLALTSPGRGESDLAQPPAPPTGRGEVNGARSEAHLAHHDQGEVNDNTDVACRTCFRPTPSGLARANDGRCATCTRTHGEDPR